VACWIENHPETKAVRGWLFWLPNDAGQYNFMAHSVVDENGQLVDITPFDPNTTREGLVFSQTPRKGGGFLGYENKVLNRPLSTV
jgi:hypothetical protein